jgi:NAD-dependent SIR2 family protein deacetylase
MDSDLKNLIETCAGLISAADSVIITAGAGMGVDSGMPDFRGQEGFWNTYPALARAKIPFQQIACPAAFHENPARAWGFYGHRLAMYRQLEPHAGFALLKKWGENRQQGYRVFTSNVDGHFQKAGFHHDGIYECHGSIHHLQCLTPCCDAIWPADDFNPEVDTENCLLLNPPPLCPHCGNLARPNILMFGDWGWHESRSEHQAAQLNRWLDTVNKPVVIEIGAGTAIPSVRLIGEQIVRQGNGKMIRINLREPAIKPRYGIGLAMGGLAALTAIGEVLGIND